MTLDLSRASLFDLHGVRELVELRRSHPERMVRMLNPPPSVRRISELLGWGGELELAHGPA